MKRIITLLTALCLCVGLCGCGSKTEDEEPTSIRIGVFEPLSGADAAHGEAELLGIRLAQREKPTVKVGKKTYTVELAVQDNAGNAYAAPEAAQKLVDAGVSLVLGSYGDAVSKTGGAVFGAAGIAVLGATCSAPELTEGNDYFFRVCSTAEVQADAMARFAFRQMDVSSAYCVAMPTESGTRQLTAFASAFTQEGGSAVTETLSDPPDLIAALLRAESEKARVIFAPIPADYVKQLISLSRSLEIAIPIVGTDILDNDSLLERPANAEEGDLGLRIYVSAFYIEGANRSFDEKLRGFTGYDPQAEEPGPDPVSSAAALGYDAYMMALHAIEIAGSINHADILAVMPAVAYAGITGRLRFADNGDALRDSIYVKRADYINGVWKQERSAVPG
ncbi:MAG: ABC transporter substrate-binding protein [Oscillospiraceae bacterium]|nr:ABC transporter substrate-binding protein [Oscillospiraceae bacterium]